MNRSNLNKSRLFPESEKSPNTKSTFEQKDDHIYASVIISHPQKSTTLEIPCEYKETFFAPIVENPSDMHLAIRRFSVPGRSIPIFIFQVQDGQANPNLGIYSVTMSYAGDDYQTYLIFVPDQTVIPTPSAPIPYQLNSAYYWVFSYQQMVRMINTAIATSFAAMKAAHPGAPPTEAPFLLYDESTQLFSMIFQESYSAGGAPTLSYNTSLSRFLDGFDCVFNGIGTNGKSQTFNVYNTGSNAWAAPGGTIPAPPAAPDYLRMTQEYTTIVEWYSVKSIVFTTNSIPVKQQTITTQLPTGSQIILGSNNSSLVITDFEPLFDKAGDARSTLQYYPQGPLRYIDLLSQTPLRTLDFKVWWTDETGRMYPIMLESGQACTMLFSFEKKFNGAMS